MSVWSARRKARNYSPPPPDPKDDLTIRVAHRICAAYYAGVCDCQQRGLQQVCDASKLAAQHAFAEIMGG